MKRVGFLAKTSWARDEPQVFKPNMHWSASTTSTPSSLIIFLMQGRAHDLAWAGFSWMNIRPTFDLLSVKLGHELHVSDTLGQLVSLARTIRDERLERTERYAEWPPYEN